MALAENGVDLGVKSRFDLRILRQQIPRPCERVRGSLVSGEKNRERLIAQLNVAHSAVPSPSVSVASRQHGEKVAAIFA